jgi:hypothetical protein
VAISRINRNQLQQIHRNLYGQRGQAPRRVAPRAMDSFQSVKSIAASWEKLFGAGISQKPVLPTTVAQSNNPLAQPTTPKTATPPTTTPAATTDAIDASLVQQGLIKDVFPMDPKLVADAQQMIANYKNVATEKGFNGNKTISNDFWDAHQMSKQDLRKALMGDGKATPVTPKAIPPYDPSIGPRITMDMVTPQMLIQPYSSDLLKNMVDPAAFMNMRSALLNAPTDAAVVSVYDGSRTPLNQANFSTQDQADAMAKLMKDTFGVDNQPVDGAFHNMFYYDYGTDNRRSYQLGNMNVGLLMQTFATNSFEQATSMLKSELGN